jgi:hypothetical protein
VGLKVGDTIPDFGGYEWQVLAIEGGRALVITKDIIDLRAYNEEYVDTTWETSTLRAWLNADFYKNAFDTGEQAIIADTTVINDDNPDYGTDGGNDTTDKVFLLSIDEAKRYFISDQARIANLNLTQAQMEDAAKRVIAKPEFDGQYAYSEALDMIRKSNGKAYPWWLRSPGVGPSDAAFVAIGGDVFSGGHGFGVDVVAGVRPAMWVKVPVSLSWLPTDIAPEHDAVTWEFGWDTGALFSTSPYEYSDELARLSLMLCRISYYDDERIPYALYDVLGFRDYETLPAENIAGTVDHVKPEIAWQPITVGGQQKNLVVIVLHGTYGIPEWVSDFDFLPMPGTPDHEGFYLAAHDVYNDILKFELHHDELLDKSQNVYLITGHSRGGAVANLLAKRLIDDGISDNSVFTYTFATPNTTLDPAGSYPIFNIVDGNDPVPQLPPSGYKYGMTLGYSGTEGMAQLRACYGQWSFIKGTLWALIPIPIVRAGALAVRNHYPDNYMALLDSGPPSNVWDGSQWLYVSVACPTDVELRISGEVVASVIGDELVCDDTVFAWLDTTDEADGTKKYFLINQEDIAGQGFDIAITATGDGSMGYTAYTIDGSSDGESRLLLEEDDVALTTGDVYTSHIDIIGGSAVLADDGTEAASQGIRNAVLVTSVVGVLASATLVWALIASSRRRKWQ